MSDLAQPAFNASPQHDFPYLPRPSLLSLPPHLLHQVTSYLDRPTCIDLALASSHIRPYAESRAWQDLTISAQRRFSPTPNTPYEFARPLGGYRLYAIREMYTWEPEARSLDEGRAQSEALAGYMNELKGLLLKNENWRKGVRRVFIDVDRLLCMEFLEVLEVVKETVKVLEMYPPGFPYSSLANTPLCTPLQLFRDAPIRLAALEDLSLPIGLDWDETLCAVLRCTPNLRRLRLSSIQPYSGSWGETMVYPRMKIDVESLPVLPLLRKLEVDEMSENFIAVLSKLVNAAEGLQKVGLRDPSRSWTPEGGNELITALRWKKSLRYLGMTERCLGQVEEGEFDNLEEISLVQDARPWGRSLLEVGSGSTSFPSRWVFSGLAYVNFQSVLIPSLPNLKTLHSYSNLPDESRSIVWSTSTNSLGLPAPLHRISSTILSRLNAAPNLTTITFPSRLSNEQIPHHSFWASPQAFESQARVILVRTYHNGATEEVFTHIRSYAAMHSHIEDGLIYRSENVWEEYLDFSDGRQNWGVPGGVLNGVYESLGAGDQGRIAWTEPGRELLLQESAWTLLRGMRRSVLTLDT